MQDIDTKRIEAVCKSAMLGMTKRCAGISEVVIATRDGFAVSSWRSSPEMDSRLAAMTSSALAVAEAIVEECKLGTCSNVLIEGSDGKMIVVAVGLPSYPLLLAVRGSDSALTGQLIFACRDCCSEILSALAARQ